MIETKLPNILSLMNNEKLNLGGGNETGSINDNNFEYDDTELLSKMFSKD